MHFVYVIYSVKLSTYYTGETPNPEERLRYHNSEELNTNSTKHGIPWEIILLMECDDRSHARRVESHIKRMKSKVFIQNLIKYAELRMKIIEMYK